MSQRSKHVPGGDRLRAFEAELLALRARGLSYKRIAERLRIERAVVVSESTVVRYFRDLDRKAARQGFPSAMDRQGEREIRQATKWAAPGPGSRRLNERERQIENRRAYQLGRFVLKALEGRESELAGLVVNGLSLDAYMTNYRDRVYLGLPVRPGDEIATAAFRQSLATEVLRGRR